MNRLLRFLVLLFLALPAGPHAQLAAGEKAMAVRLIAETERPAPGLTVTLALVMTPRNGWHGYWQNPGDAGVGTRIAWRLPRGAAAGPIRFPVPERLMIQGLIPSGNSPEQLAAFIRDDTKRWEPVVKLTGVRLD